MTDWGTGHYERVAAQLLPAARAAIDHAAPGPGERVVDVGCGTGNAALLAAERGAAVTGVDPAPRLLRVARAQAAAQGLDATFALGEAAALPIDDRSVDVAVSVFGVIFAPDARAAAAELARVTKPQGRIVLCAWIPQGALFEVMRLRREAMNATKQLSAHGPPDAWYDEHALHQRFAPLGFSCELHEEQISFGAPSVEHFLESELQDHPMWVQARAALEPLGRMQSLLERAREVYAQANEETASFGVSSRYVVASLRRS